MAMRRAQHLGVAACVCGLMFLLAGIVSCSGSQAQREPVVASQPVAEPPAETVPEQEDVTAEEPAPAATTTAPSAPETAAVVPPATSQSAELPPPIPDYLKVLELYDDNEPAYVNVQITSERRLQIDTRNVRLMRIDRQRLPMNTRQSIVLRLDGQGIEWTARSKTEEFERSINGDWSPSRRRKP